MQIKQPSGVKLILSEGTICPLHQENVKALNLA